MQLETSEGKKALNILFNFKSEAHEMPWMLYFQGAPHQKNIGRKSKGSARG